MRLRAVPEWGTGWFQSVPCACVVTSSSSGGGSGSSVEWWLRRADTTSCVVFDRSHGIKHPTHLSLQRVVFTVRQQLLQTFQCTASSPQSLVMQCTLALE